MILEERSLSAVAVRLKRASTLHEPDHWRSAPVLPIRGRSCQSTVKDIWAPAQRSRRLIDIIAHSRLLTYDILAAWLCLQGTTYKCDWATEQEAFAYL